MKTACETIFWQIIPAIRREVAKTLVESGVKRADVAKRLGVSQAALTQYLRGKRGKKDLPEWIKEKIREYVRRRNCVNFCEICWEIRQDPRFVELVPGVERGCAHA